MRKVKGKDGLVKDPSTNTVINSDENAYINHKRAKKRILEEKKEKDELKERLAKVEEMVEKLAKPKPQPRKRKTTATKKQDEAKDE